MFTATKSAGDRRIIIVVAAIACLTVMKHIWWIPFLDYPLRPGVIVHSFVSGDGLAGATDAHGGTPVEERIGFVAEMLANLGVYFLLAVVGGRLLADRPKPKGADPAVRKFWK